MKGGGGPGGGPTLGPMLKSLQRGPKRGDPDPLTPGSAHEVVAYVMRMISLYYVCPGMKDGKVDGM